MTPQVVSTHQKALLSAMEEGRAFTNFDRWKATTFRPAMTLSYPRRLFLVLDSGFTRKSLSSGMVQTYGGA